MAKRRSPFDNFPKLGVLKGPDTEYEVAPELAETKDILAEESLERPTFRLFYLLSILASVILIIRLLNLQITHGYENRFQAEGNRIRLREVEPSRGIISDSQGEPLVRNVASYNLEIYPGDLPKKAKERQSIYQLIHTITAIPVEELSKGDQNGLSSLDPIIVKENIDRQTALTWEVKLTEIPGVAIAKRPRREYVNQNALSHILGYVGKVSKQDLPLKGYGSTSYIGKAGVESTYESDLRGQVGREQIEVDAQGRLQRVLSRTPPVAGNNLILNIDNRLQSAATAALVDSMNKNKSDKGAIVVLDPRDGSIRALVSLPAYDNNLFARGITADEYRTIIQDKNHPMVNRAVSGTYPSGSVIKPVVGAAGLQENVIKPNTTLDTSAGAIKIGQWVFPDWTIHGVTDIRRAIAESNDIFFYSVGGGWQSIKGLGINRLSNWLRQFGFGSPTGIDLPSEKGGLVPDDEWKRKAMKEPWFIGDTYHLSIGQGYFLTTPLQIANATTTIANNGELLKPHIVKKIVANDGTIVRQINKEVVRGNFINPQHLAVIREGMRQAVTGGSARQLTSLPVPAAAKTGTAQFGKDKKTHAWFSAFAPYDKPELVVVVLVEGGGEGHAVAGPVAKSILETYFSLSPRP